MPSPRSISGPNSSSIRPVPVPRSSSAADRPVGERGLDRAFDRRVGDMKAADAVPFGGMLAEVGLRGGSTRSAHRGEPSPVAHHDRIRRIEPPDQRLRDVGNTTALAEAIERPASLAIAIDEARFGEQLQMARDARLRLAQDLGEIGDRKFGFGEQREDAQARALARGAQHRVQGFKVEGRRTHDGLVPNSLA